MSLRQQAVNLTYHYIDIANQHFGLNIPHVPVDFNLRGTTAGKAWGGRKIQYQPVLLEENGDKFLNRTVPHEVAHIVVYHLYPQARMRMSNGRRMIKPHGKEWKRVMAIFGIDSSRCHSYDVSNVSTQKTKLARAFKYKCNCKVWDFTVIRHRRCLKGMKYSCPKCRGVLEAV